jgi:cytochrome c biogenesis factor
MLNVALAVHNVLRWLVLVLAVWALYRSYRGWLGGRSWQDQDSLAGRLMTIGFDLQLLVGLFVAALSPLVRTALQNMSAIGTSDVIRFFAAEHIPVMVVAWILVHVTSVVAKRADDDKQRHQRTAIGFSVALALVLLATPWFRPFLPGL